MCQLAEADLATQARGAALQIGTQLQTGTKVASQSFNRFVEGESQYHNPNEPHSPEKQEFWDSFGESPRGPEKDKREFWDSFGEPPKSPPADKKGFWDNLSEAAPERKKKEPEKKDFWDEFAAAGEVRQQAGQQQKKAGSIGTAAMRKPAAGAGGKKDEDWGEW